MSYEFSNDGTGAWKKIELIWFRWGGGANPGMYHVFVVGHGKVFGPLSKQCVVDDFGDLIPVS